MKPLRPSVIVTVGPVLLGFTVAVVTWIAMPRSRDLASFGWALAIAVAVGLAMFGPIAAVLAVGHWHPQWLVRHSWRFSFYCSMAMALSIGYLAACTWHNVSDNLMLVAIAVLFLGATVKAAVSYALRQETGDGVH